MIIAIVNQKGGTGKTTTAVNLGAALAEKGHKILLVDLDSQGNLSYSLGIVDMEQSISTVFLGECTIDMILQESEEMHIVPSEVSLADVELSIAESDSRESLFKEILKDISHKYDYIFLDCPPSLSLLTVNALNSAEKVIIPMEMDALSLQGLDQISITIDKVKNAFNPKLEIQGILPVRIDKRRKLSIEVYEHIRDNYNIKIFESQIRNNVKASEAPSFGQSVIRYAPKSNSAIDYTSLAEEFLMLNNN